MFKKILFLLSIVPTLFSCAEKPIATLEVKNALAMDRTEEVVEVDISSLGNVNSMNEGYVLTDKQGTKIPFIVQSGSLVFQASVPANATAVYELRKGEPAEVKAKTFARFVPERSDDFAWENDLAAYRMYGPALAYANPSNGVDLWLKRTDELIVNEFYRLREEDGMSYHVDHGKGLDCYKVAHTLGAGGIAPYTSKAWVSDYFNSYSEDITTPFYSEFTLVYDTIKVDGKYYKQTITIRTEAGSVLNKAVVKYEGEDMPMQLAAGIILHDGSGVQVKDGNIIAYAEDATSDKGIPSGRNYVGVYVPGAKQITTDEEHLLIIADYKVGNEFTYYFGGGWNKWKFPEDKDWFDAVARFEKLKESPLAVSIK